MSPGAALRGRQIEAQNMCILGAMGNETSNLESLGFGFYEFSVHI